MAAAPLSKMMKPAWLNKKISLKDCAQVKSMLKDLGLHTVCEEALCPNIGECFARGQATFIILGAVCTRACRFCGVSKGSPLEPDPEEPERVAEAVRKLGLKHAVITSVTRDDLPDGGASVFARTILALRRGSTGIRIEALIPDFRADRDSLRRLVDSAPDIIAHNIETVPSLYKEIRPSGSSYSRSLQVLRLAKEMAPSIPLKSGLMLGLGEKREEVLEVFSALLEAGCVFLSLGQYLAPSANHYPVKEYITPGQFDCYSKQARKMGFIHVESGPYVRSSYKAEDYLSD
jgi:lipoic acid synthetase